MFGLGILGTAISVGSKTFTLARVLVVVALALIASCLASYFAGTLVGAANQRAETAGVVTAEVQAHSKWLVEQAMHNNDALAKMLQTLEENRKVDSEIAAAMAKPVPAGVCVPTGVMRAIGRLR